MYGKHLIFEHADGSVRQAKRLSLGDTSGRDESWLVAAANAYVNALRPRLRIAAKS